MSDPGSLTVGIVGPCAAGKTTLAQGLRPHGFTVRQIAQEHSYVPHMWKRLVDPDILIFLDVSHRVSLQRRPQDFTAGDYARQRDRLAHARSHANLYLDTDPLAILEVLDLTLAYLLAQSRT